MATDPSFSGVRKASYTPNEESLTNDEPKTLNYQKHDSTRETTKVRSDRNANITDGGSRCGAWWSRPKIITAAVAAAIILLLIIILPSVLVPRNARQPEESETNGTQSELATDVIYVKANMTGRIVAVGNNTAEDFLTSVRSTPSQTRPNQTDSTVARLKRSATDANLMEDANFPHYSTAPNDSNPNSSGYNDEEAQILGDLSRMLQESAQQSELCGMVECADVVPGDLAISHSVILVNFFLGFNHTSLRDLELHQDLLDSFDKSMESSIAVGFGKHYVNYRIDNVDMHFDFDHFCVANNLSCAYLLNNISLAKEAVPPCYNSSSGDCSSPPPPFIFSTLADLFNIDDADSGHNDSIVGADILIVERNETTTSAADVREVRVVETTTILPPTTFLLWPKELDNCSRNGFLCANQKKRVSSSQRCNGVKDCEDGSDEDLCEKCLTAFKCPSSTDRKRFFCLSPNRICDGIPDCPGEMDESPNFYCKAQCVPGIEFKCRSADICIPIKFICDGEPHCPNGEDEQFCTNATLCHNGAFFCDQKCLPKWKRCDGTVDCTDGSDESDCSCMECSGDNRVLCHVGRGSCILKSRVCNGVKDCPGGEDELNCPGWCQEESPVDMITCKDGQKHSKRHACAGLIPACDGSCDSCDAEVTFSCGGKCVPRSKVCDGTPDCQDGSDEKNCACRGPNTISCANEPGRCIKPTQVCDGVSDCQGGADEQNCPACTNNPRGFYCAVKRQCFSSDHRCNGIVDCPDYSDEDSCSCTDCKDTLGYSTFFCQIGRRCLSRSYLCSGEFNFHCAGNPAEDQLWCASRTQLTKP